MPPRSPLPPRDGLSAAWVRTYDRGKESPQWKTLADFLRFRLADEAPVDEMLANGRFVKASGRPISTDEPYRPNTFIWFHRDRREEIPVPFEINVLFQDDRILVVDKPAFLSTIPRGRHVLQSVVVRIRRDLNLPEASPAHRLDRLTSGVLVLTTSRRWRASYQSIFEHQGVSKTYEALATVRPELSFPRIVRNHLVKERGRLQVRVREDLPPNAETLIELVETRGFLGRYRLSPLTGKTHQLRVHLNGLGLPILGDPLYPEVLDVSIDDFTHPLALLAKKLSFRDPIDGSRREFNSQQRLPWPEEK